MKRWKLYTAAAALTLILSAAAVLNVSVNVRAEGDDTIPQRVYFGDISVGGMTEEEAAAEVEDYVEQLGSTKVIFAAGENEVETTAGDLGLSWSNPDIVKEAAGLGKSGNLIVRYMAMKDLEHEDRVYEIGFSVDTAKIRSVLEANAQALNTEAKDGGLTRENGTFAVIPGSQGVTVNLEESVAVIEEYFKQPWEEHSGKVELVADVVEPRGSEAELSKVKDVLGSFQTEYASHSSGNRSTNISNGATKINGSVVYPGDQFSVYEMVSPFTPENGYELAGAYENGQTVESYGGGICQVSTTLYNAVIRAELEVVERFAHSMIVSYVAPSADAAIAGTYKDLKFINNTNAPIYIEGYTSGGYLTFTVYGQESREAGREVIFESETTSSTDPGVEFKGTGAPIGSITRVQGSHEGKTARLWKIVKVNGEEISREEFNNSTYRPSPTIYEVGTFSGFGNPDAVANINAALATQDEATIRAAAAAWSDEALAAMLEQQRLEQEQQQQQQQQEQQQQEQQQQPEQDPGAEKPEKEPEKPEKEPEKPEKEPEEPEKDDKDDKAKEEPKDEEGGEKPQE
ncbi:MAG: hypothetical protein HFI76_10845 [Lachnospiraceae bacterium]|nr:hypothetical protein [Lachnospiraceae bacterium]